MTFSNSAGTEGWSVAPCDEISLQSPLTRYGQKLIFHYHLYQFSCYPHTHERARHFLYSEARTATSSLMYQKGHCREDPSDGKTPKHRQMLRTSCSVLSARALLKVHWSPCNLLHSVTASWVAAQHRAQQMMFCRHPCFLDALTDIHPQVWTSVHKGLGRKILRDFIV